jgi:two-component system chemotaxis response regulator CheB
MNARDIIVIGTSAGGFSALRSLLHQLPPDLPATIVIVQHMSSLHSSNLPALLQRAGNLKVSHPTDGERFVKNHVYVAPPDRHLMIEDGHIRLSQGPKENLTRPAVDPLFRSAALAFRGRVVGIVLTGELDDGTAGLWSVKYRGGITVVQDPLDAEHPSMPRSAANNVKIDYCLPLSEIGPLLVRLASDPFDDQNVIPSEKLEIENRIALDDPRALDRLERLGELTALTCPDCHGSLWQLKEDEFVRFRCRTGHAYTAEALLSEQQQALENILRNALRSAVETSTLARHLRDHSHSIGDQDNHGQRESALRDADQRVHLIRQVLNHEQKRPKGSAPVSSRRSPRTSTSSART